MISQYNTVDVVILRVLTPFFWASTFLRYLGITIQHFYFTLFGLRSLMKGQDPKCAYGPYYEF